MRLSIASPGQTGANLAFDAWLRHVEGRVEGAALRATHEAAKKLTNTIRDDMRSAGLGTLGQAITFMSDLRERRVKRNIGGGFSASGFIYVRTRNERTVGALIAYTQGAKITPRKGRWLWFPTDQIQRMVGRARNRQRLTPALWERYGLDRRVGPLVRIDSVNGNPLLIVQNVGVDASGRKRSARSLTKSGLPRKGQVAREMIVAFIGIPFTSRAARVDVRARYREAMAELPALMRRELGRN